MRGEIAELFDGLNLHTYAQLEGWPTWRRSFPEDQSCCTIFQMWKPSATGGRTRPDKPVWITEFGYDSSTQPPEKSGDFAQWIGVSDTQQAQWLVRSLLVFSALPVERAYLYFFNDDDKPGLHASAASRGIFSRNRSYHALTHLQRVLGEYRFAAW